METILKILCWGMFFSSSIGLYGLAKKDDEFGMRMFCVCLSIGTILLIYI